jgi:hypothetical protein
VAVEISRLGSSRQGQRGRLDLKEFARELVKEMRID